MKRTLVTIIVAIAIWGIIGAMWTSGGEETLLISAAVCAFFGWRVLNMIQPAMFIWMPVAGWIIYFCVKFIVAAIIGWFVAPYIIAKKFCSKEQDV